MNLELEINKQAITGLFHTQNPRQYQQYQLIKMSGTSVFMHACRHQEMVHLGCVYTCRK